MKRKKSLVIERRFCKSGNPYNEVPIGKRTVEFKSGDTVLFHQDNVEVPSGWSDFAAFIMASKYFRGHVGEPEREHSVRQLFDRVVNTIAENGKRLGYFDGPNAKIFGAELKKLMLEQRLAFNSPVYFNLGAEPSPQLAACFILGLDDNLDSISNLQTQEIKIFSQGSGAGSNLSNLRSMGEPLSRGGMASGPLSFMRAYDSWAGIIKSGGTQRRASKLQRLDIDHPDVFNGKEDGSDFISYKSREEEKARVLVDGGLTVDEAYTTVSGQNCNLTVGVTDAFMKAAVEKQPWTLKYVLSKKPAKTFPASQILDSIAANAWKCGDPGLQFDDRINEWNSVPKFGKIRSSNPCQPGWARVLTPDGIRTFGTIDVGSTIWSGKRWTKVTKKVATGCKPVFGFMTRAGTFYGTKDHRIVQNGSKVRADVAETIDITSCGMANLDTNEYKVSAQDVMDGLVFGDGMVHKASVSLPPVLCVGENDHDYFDSEVAHLFEKSREGLSRFAWLVTTTISREECPRTYERTVPDRFLFGKPMTVRGFLRGLYSANGSVVSSRVTLKASSRQVVEAVQMMLSVLGIKSYYTINKEHDVEFSNGTYTCKESYDVNISTDRSAFRDLIGFIQQDKQKRLYEACKRPLNEKKVKTSYEIVEVASFGRMNVFDITVDDPEHTYWTDGLLVSNCAEVMAPDNNACNLLSLNLLSFVSVPDGIFFEDEFLAAVRLSIIAQDILVEISSYPTPEVDKNSKALRPLGLGFCNLGGLAMSLGLPYDSEAARSWAGGITALMTATAFSTSMDIADVKGSFSEFEENRKAMVGILRKHKSRLEAMMEKQLSQNDLMEKALTVWNKLVQDIHTRGVRNSQVTLVAPTGTVGIMMDAATGGIEPALWLTLTKKMASGGEAHIINSAAKTALDALHYPKEDQEKILKYIEENGTIEGSVLRDHDLPVFDCAYPSGKGVRFISPMGHLMMMAAVQPLISGSISKTVGCPNDTTVDQIRDIYINSWKLGLKAVIVYRQGSKIIQPLSGTKDATNKRTIYRRTPMPKTRTGETRAFQIGGVKGYFTINFFPGTRKPGELFVTLAKEGSTLRGLMDCFVTAISLCLQSGVPIDILVDKFVTQKFEPQGVTGDPEIPIATSIVDYIFRYIRKHFIDGDEEPPVTAAEAAKLKIELPMKTYGPSYETCPVCGNMKVRTSTTCSYCPNQCPGQERGTCGG